MFSRVSIGVAGLLVAASLLASCAAPRVNTGGVVTDYVKGSPVAGVTVHVNCDRLKLLHGSETIRTLTTVTDAAGRYAFDPSDLAGCTFLAVAIDKPGYRAASRLYVDSCPDYDERRLPSGLCVVEESQSGAAAVRYLNEQASQLIPQLDQAHRQRVRVDQGDALAFRRQLGPYLQTFKFFYQTNVLASTDAQRRRVKELYCRVLESMHGDLTAAEMAFAAQLTADADNVQGLARTPPFRYDYDAYVAPLCGS